MQLTNQFNALHTKHMNLQANVQSHNYASDEELERLRQLNKTLLETCKDLKLKAENAKNEEIKRLQKENSRLKGYLKSLGHIFKTVMEIESDYTEQETNEAWCLLEKEKNTIMNNYDKLLKSYADPQSYKEYAHEPFFQGEFAYATNGQSCIQRKVIP